MRHSVATEPDGDKGYCCAPVFQQHGYHLSHAPADEDCGIWSNFGDTLGSSNSCVGEGLLMYMYDNPDCQRNTSGHNGRNGLLPDTGDRYINFQEHDQQISQQPRDAIEVDPKLQLIPWDVHHPPPQTSHSREPLNQNYLCHQLEGTRQSDNYSPVMPLPLQCLPSPPGYIDYYSAPPTNAGPSQSNSPMGNMSPLMSGPLEIYNPVYNSRSDINDMYMLPELTACTKRGRDFEDAISCGRGRKRRLSASRSSSNDNELAGDQSSPADAGMRIKARQRGPANTGIASTCRGVYFDAIRSLWRANWPEESIIIDHGTSRIVDVRRCTRTKGFSAKKFGYEEAQKMAVKHREKMTSQGMVRHYLYRDEYGAKRRKCRDAFSDADRHIEQDELEGNASASPC